MIITDRFVFLHLHKSGGTFVNELLLRFIPRAHSVGYHLPRLLIPAEALHLPILGFVRNPWSYYVSWYNFQSQRPKPNALFRILSDEGRLDFAGTVRQMLDLGFGSPHLDAVIRALPGSYGNSGLNLPKFALAPIRNSRRGFYSYLYEYVHGEPGPRLHVERADQLRQRLLQFLDLVGQRVTTAMHDAIRDTPERNTSMHGPYVEFYSDELRDLVAERDRIIIDKHGFRFGD